MQKLNFKQTLVIASMLFGMFFGAGNLIFPVHLGQLSGSNFALASIGFIITAVGLPILGIVAIGVSDKKDILQISKKVDPVFAYVFTLLLILSITVFIAVPRCASTSFETGIAPLLSSDIDENIAHFIFSVLFFIIVAIFSLRPNKIEVWIGKIINPIFVVLLVILLIVAITNSETNVAELTPTAGYDNNPVFKGLLEGYETMDAMASLIFGLIVIKVIKKYKVTKKNAIAKNTLKAALFTAAAMGLVYFCITLMGAQSLGIFEITNNGAVALSQICSYYFGETGQWILTFIIVLACIKTAIGVITCGAEEFTKIFPNCLNNKIWTIIFIVAAFCISNLNLTQIISFTTPVLELIYPFCIVMIIVTIFGRFYNYDKIVYKFSVYFTIIPAIFTTIKSIQAAQLFTIDFNPFLQIAYKIFPFFDINFGWVLPFVIGYIVGIIVYKFRRNTDDTHNLDIAD